MKPIILPYKRPKQWRKIFEEIPDRYPALADRRAYFSEKQRFIPKREYFPELYKTHEELCDVYQFPKDKRPFLVLSTLDENILEPKAGYIVEEMDRLSRMGEEKNPSYLLLSQGHLERYNAMPIWDEATQHWIPNTQPLAPELKGVLSHELSHHKHRKKQGLLTIAVGNTLGVLTGIASSAVLLMGSLFVGRKTGWNPLSTTWEEKVDNSTASLIGLAAATTAVGAIAVKIFSIGKKTGEGIVGRWFERLADREGAEASGLPGAGYSYFAHSEKLGKAYSGIQDEPDNTYAENHSWMQRFRGRCHNVKCAIVDKIESIKYDLFASHPRRNSRLKQFRKMAGNDAISAYQQQHKDRLAAVDCKLDIEMAAIKANDILDRELAAETTIEPDVEVVDKILTEQVEILSDQGKKALMDFRAAILLGRQDREEIYNSVP